MKLLSGGDARPSLASGYLDSNRDMLRLYGGVCNEAEAQELAAEAVQHIRNGQMQAGFAGYEIALITLRFLRDTFRARAGILRPYSRELNTVVVKLWNSADLMKQKHAAEHLCLLPVPITCACCYAHIGGKLKDKVWLALASCALRGPLREQYATVAGDAYYPVRIKVG